jgi:hypothetical protein
MSKRGRQGVAKAEAWRPRPPLPQRRVILAGFGLLLLCVGMALFFLLPSRSLVQDLRSRGVSAAATVIGVDSKPKYVKVRLVSRPKEGTLSEYAGMLPETETGASVIVTYDPEAPLPGPHPGLGSGPAIEPAGLRHFGSGGHLPRPHHGSDLASSLDSWHVRPGRVPSLIDGWQRAE